MENKKGILKLRIVEGKDLIAREKDGTSNPFVKIQILGSTTKQVKIRKRILPFQLK